MINILGVYGKHKAIFQIEHQRRDKEHQRYGRDRDSPFCSGDVVAQRNLHIQRPEIRQEYMKDIVTCFEGVIELPRKQKPLSVDQPARRVDDQHRDHGIDQMIKPPLRRGRADGLPLSHQDNRHQNDSHSADFHI
ncbi:hypothetical protein SDC9_99306 [bioreactor metagenome]|uniref:Uncharacterized protein n=1 Tax=bioreactor metagenome TaxID=1076179 RepID=A0A645AHY5_9ZZZZ